MLGAVLVAPIGGILGLVSGALAGTTEVYRFEPDAAAPEISVKPTNGGATGSLLWSF